MKKLYSLGINFQILLLPLCVYPEPLKLLTLPTAILPREKYIVGLQELGIRYSNFYMDTNPLMNFLCIYNLKVEGNFPLERGQLTLGIRGFQVDEKRAEEFAKSKNPDFEKFLLSVRGFTSFPSYSYQRYHLALLYGGAGDLQTCSFLIGREWEIFPLLVILGECGYEFIDGFLRGGIGLSMKYKSFSLKAGVITLSIDDPMLFISWLPIVDFYFVFGE